MIRKKQASLNLSFENFLSKINFNLEKYAPLKKVSKDKVKFKNKVCIASGIQNSVTVKKKLKDADLKNEAHFKYKQYRNIFSTLLERINYLFFKSRKLFAKIFSNDFLFTKKLNTNFP